MMTTTNLTKLYVAGTIYVAIHIYLFGWFAIISIPLSKVFIDPIYEAFFK